MERSAWLRPALDYPSCQFNQYAAASSMALSAPPLASVSWNESDERGSISLTSHSLPSMTHSAFTSVSARAPQGYFHSQGGLGANSPGFPSPFAKPTQDPSQTTVYKPHIYKPPWIQAAQGKDSPEVDE